MGATLVDTEINVDEARQSDLLNHFQGHLVKASHAYGGSAGDMYAGSFL